MCFSFRRGARSHFGRRRVVWGFIVGKGRVSSTFLPFVGGVIADLKQRIRPEQVAKVFREAQEVRKQAVAGMRAVWSEDHSLDCIVTAIRVWYWVSCSLCNNGGFFYVPSFYYVLCRLPRQSHAPCVSRYGHDLSPCTTCDTSYMVHIWSYRIGSKVDGPPWF